MAIKNVCKFEKFGYCKLKEECKEYHPTEVCEKKNCNVSRCKRRHPKTCKFFESGYCKFKEACKYDHKEKVTVNELLERNIKLEKQIMILRSLNEQQADAIIVLNERLQHVEIESQIYSKQYGEDTLVDDDSSKKRKLDDVPMNPKNETTNDIRMEIEFSVDVQKKINDINSNISDKSSEDAKLVLKTFQHHVNETAKKMKMKGEKKEFFDKIIINFNVDCNKILVNSFITFGFRDLINEKLQVFLKELMKLKHIRSKNN